MNFNQTPLERLREEAWIEQYRAALKDTSPKESRYANSRGSLVRIYRHVISRIDRFACAVSALRTQKPAPATATLPAPRLSPIGEATESGRKKAS